MPAQGNQGLAYSYGLNGQGILPFRNFFQIQVK